MDGADSGKFFRLDRESIVRQSFIGDWHHHIENIFTEPTYKFRWMTCAGHAGRVPSRIHVDDGGGEEPLKQVAEADTAARHGPRQEDNRGRMILTTRLLRETDGRWMAEEIEHGELEPEAANVQFCVAV